LIAFRYLQTSTVTAIHLGDPYAPARGYLWIRRQLIPPVDHIPDKDDEKAYKSKHTKKKKTKKHKKEKSDSDAHKLEDSIDDRRNTTLSSVKNSTLADTSTELTLNDSTSIAASTPIYKNSPSPYTGPSDADSPYYQNYYNSPKATWNNDNDPDTRENTAPSEDIYDVIDPDHQPVIVIPTPPAERQRISRKTSLDRILDEQIPKSHKTGHKLRANPSDNGFGQTRSTEFAVEPITLPSEEIYDQIGPVQSVTAVPVPPPMPNKKQTESRSRQLIGDDINTVTSNKANQESIYLQPVNVNPVNDVYQNVPDQSRNAKNTANVDDTYLMPQISHSKAKKSFNKKSQKANSSSVTAAEPVYLVPQVATAESIYMVPSNVGVQNQSEGINYANIDHVATLNKRRNADESVYLQPNGITNTMASPQARTSEYKNPVAAAEESIYLQPHNVEQPNTLESEYLAPRAAVVRPSGTEAAESVYQSLQPKDAAPRIYESLRKTSNPQVMQTVQPIQQSTYETLRSANAQPSSHRTGLYQSLNEPSAHNGPNSRDAQTANGIYQKLSKAEISPPNVYDTIRRK